MLREVLSFDLYLIVTNSGLLDITYLFFEHFFVTFFYWVVMIKNTREKLSLSS